MGKGEGTGYMNNIFQQKKTMKNHKSALVPWCHWTSGHIWRTCGRFCGRNLAESRQAGVEKDERDKVVSWHVT